MSEMTTPSALFSGTKTNIMITDEESDDEVLLITEGTLFLMTPWEATL